MSTSSATPAAATAAAAVSAAATAAAAAAEKKKNSIAPHVKARGPYTGDAPARFPVPDEFVRWSVPYPAYAPVSFLAKSVADRPVWADKPEEVRSLKFNQRDGKINRISFTGKYDVDAEGRPLNPCGRTGMVERGLLGRYGPNHAADPIVTRWKRGADGSLVFGANNLPVLEFIAIKRKDNNEWAIPGGMVDAGEVVSVTLKREFAEETMNSLEASEEEKKEIHRAVEQLFNNGREIYRGYVDDPRNTDNAWMETTAMLFHDEKGVAVARFKLKAGDDAGDVAWTTVTEDVKLYASHRDFVLKARQLLWDDYHGGSSPPAKRQ